MVELLPWCSSYYTLRIALALLQCLWGWHDGTLCWRSPLRARVAKSLVDSWLLAFECVQTVFWVRGVQFSVAEVLIIHGSWHLRAFRASSESRECSFQLPRRRLAHGPGIWCLASFGARGVQFCSWLVVDYFELGSSELRDEAELPPQIWTLIRIYRFLNQLC